jgi:hypothetical protein
MNIIIIPWPASSLCRYCKCCWRHVDSDLQHWEKPIPSSIHDFWWYGKTLPSWDSDQMTTRQHDSGHSCQVQ